MHRNIPVDTSLNNVGLLVDKGGLVGGDGDGKEDDARRVEDAVTGQRVPIDRQVRTLLNVGTCCVKKIRQTFLFQLQTGDLPTNHK